MKICAIDIGTNSTLYLLAKIDQSRKLQPLYFQSETTQLGKSLKKRNLLLSAPTTKTINTVKKFLAHAKKNGAEKFTIVGTSALREAKNKKQFCQKLQQQTGKKVKIISAIKEAQLTHLAVSRSLKTDDSNLIIIDIGGGSTEIIYCKTQKKKIIKSLPLGAVHLTEKFRNNISAMESHIRSILSKNKVSLKPPTSKQQLIGVGGTITTLAALLKKLKQYDPKAIHRSKIKYQSLDKMIKKFQDLSLKKRRQLIPFSPKRGNIMLAGLVILRTLMNHFRIKKLTVCDRGLLYGLILDVNTGRSIGKKH